MNFKRRRPRRWVRCVMCTPGRAGNSLRGAPRRTLLRFAPIALLALLASCRGADARPDEFSLEVGTGDYDGSIEGRSMDGGGEWAALGWTWYLSAPGRPEAVRSTLEAPVVTEATGPAPEPSWEPIGEPLPILRGPDEDGSWFPPGLIAFVAATALGLAVWINRALIGAGARGALRWLWSTLGRALQRLRPGKARHRAPR